MAKLRRSLSALPFPYMFGGETRPVILQEVCVKNQSDRLHSLTAGVAITALLAFAGAAGAADPGPAGEQPGTAGAARSTLSFVSVTPVYQSSADLDGGGDVQFQGAVFRGGIISDLGGGTRAGITLIYDYLDYSFSNPTAFDYKAPWGVLQRYGVVAPLSFAIGNDWILGASPSFEWFKENGASSADSFTWGATFSASRRFENGNMLGLGVAVFDRLEETLVFPFLTIDWRLGDRLRLVNPLASGPTGPAGLELDYEFDSDWTAGLGAAWRSLRFRLSESGPTPNGIGEERGMPVFLRVTRRFGYQAALHLYGGVVMNGQLRVEDPTGRALREVDRDTAPLFGATFVARF